MKSMVINNTSKENVPEDKNKQSPAASIILQKGVDQPKAMASPLAKFEARTVPSISASIIANRGMYSKEINSSDKPADPRLKLQSDRLSSLQSLLKPASKPSAQMEHFLKKTTSVSSSMNQSGDSPSDIKS